MKLSKTILKIFLFILPVTIETIVVLNYSWLINIMIKYFNITELSQQDIRRFYLVNIFGLLFIILLTIIGICSEIYTAVKDIYEKHEAKKYGIGNYDSKKN